MKKMICSELGGACDQEFIAETFEEIATLSQTHGKEMFEQQDENHLKVQNEMMELMKDPSKMKIWMDTKRALFDSLPEL
jgi:hypothetical protein